MAQIKLRSNHQIAGRLLPWFIGVNNSHFRCSAVEPTPTSRSVVNLRKLTTNGSVKGDTIDTAT
jgi:hypothetical protein